MRTTQWVNTLTGECLDRAALATLRAKAHRAYEANTHIFEDEFEALAAFGVVALRDLAPTSRGCEMLKAA
jgi:hypothetical protein